MGDLDKIQELIDASEDALFQKIIDRQEGALGLEEQEQPVPVPTQAELARWEQALDKLDNGNVVEPTHRRKRFGRTALLAILAAAFMLVAASALSRPFLNWIETIHEKYSQFQVGETAESKVAQWTSAYIPDSPPEGFAISDATDLDDVKYIEYANSAGDRITFYQYSPHSSVRIDTENADKTIAAWISDQTAYLFKKGVLSTLYWNHGSSVLSVEYDPDIVRESQIKAFADSLQWRPK